MVLQPSVVTFALYKSYAISTYEIIVHRLVIFMKKQGGILKIGFRRLIKM